MPLYQIQHMLNSVADERVARILPTKKQNPALMIRNRRGDQPIYIFGSLLPNPKSKLFLKRFSSRIWRPQDEHLHNRVKVPPAYTNITRSKASLTCYSATGTMMMMMDSAAHERKCCILRPRELRSLESPCRDDAQRRIALSQAPLWPCAKTSHGLRRIDFRGVHTHTHTHTWK